MFNKENLLIYNKDSIPYIKFKMIPGMFTEGTDLYLGSYGNQPSATITEFECSKNINLTKNSFNEELSYGGFSFNTGPSYPEPLSNNYSFSFWVPSLENFLNDRNYTVLINYDNIDFKCVAYDISWTGNILYHPMFKHCCEQWEEYAKNNIETDWITVSFIEDGNDYIAFNLSFSSISTSDNLKFYITDSLNNIYNEDLSDISKFEFLGDMDLITEYGSYSNFNPISVCIPKDKFLIAQVNNIFYTNSVSGCSYDQVSIYGSHKRLVFYNFTNSSPSATVYTSAGYSNQ